MSPENWQTHSGVLFSELLMQSDSSCGFINTCANSAGEMGAMNLCHLMEERSLLEGISSEFNGAAGNSFSTLMSNIDPQKVHETQLAPYLQPQNNYGSTDMFHIAQEQSVDCFPNPQICAFDGRINSSVFQNFISSNSDIISPSASASLHVRESAVVETPLHYMPRHLFNYCDDFECNDLLAQDSDMAIGLYKDSNNSLAWQSQSSLTDQKHSGQMQLYTHSSIRHEDSQEHELQFSLPQASLKRSYTVNIEDGIQPCTKKLISWTSGSSSCSSVQSKSHKLKSARAKQGSAMDPQSVAARLRRERISERLKILQDLVPNGSKFDLVTMLEKAINYVKFLQLQVKVLTTDEYWPNKDSSTTAAIVKVQDVLQEIASTRSTLAEMEKISSMDNKNGENFDFNSAQMQSQNIPFDDY